MFLYIYIYILCIIIIIRLFQSVAGHRPLPLHATPKKFYLHIVSHRHTVYGAEQGYDVISCLQEVEINFESN